MIVLMNDGVFGENVRFLREKAGLSLRKFAAYLDINEVTLRMIEIGTLRDIPYPVFKRICDWFGVDVHDIMAKPLIRITD